MREYELAGGPTGVLANEPNGSGIDLSVIIAVHNGGSFLPQCLQALAASDLRRDCWELIVVDDASTDGSALLAAEHADVIIRLPNKARGPAYARNRGFEVSRAPIVMFCDADVMVHPDVLSSFVAFFRKMPWVSAVFGSYDAHPPAPGVVSQFRNLLHHYVHQSSPGEAETFWAGCGAIRREALIDVEMFDEWHYARPEIEDIDMGRRLRRAGHRIVLRPEIQCTHMKHWTLGNVVRTDYRSRGIPWMRSLLQEEALVEFHALNLSFKERFCTGLAALATVVLAAALVTRSRTLLLAWLGLVLTVIALNLRFYGFLRDVRGFRQAIASIPLHFLFYNTAAVAGVTGYFTHILFGEPSAAPEIEAEASLGVQLWPPCPRRPANHLWRRIAEPR